MSAIVLNEWRCRVRGPGPRPRRRAAARRSWWARRSAAPCTRRCSTSSSCDPLRNDGCHLLRLSATRTRRKWQPTSGGGSGEAGCRRPVLLADHRAVSGAGLRRHVDRPARAGAGQRPRGLHRGAERRRTRPGAGTSTGTSNTCAAIAATAGFCAAPPMSRMRSRVTPSRAHGVEAVGEARRACPRSRRGRGSRGVVEARVMPRQGRGRVGQVGRALALEVRHEHDAAGAGLGRRARARPSSSWSTAEQRRRSSRARGRR